MAGTSAKKRSRPDSAPNTKKHQRPSKKQRKVLQYHSSSEDEFEALGDEIAALTETGDGKHTFDPQRRKRMQLPVQQDKSKGSKKNVPVEKVEEDEKESDDDEEEGVGAGAESDDDIDIDDEVADFTDSESEQSDAGPTRQKSKRNDPGAFATSLQKILSTKLSNSKKADAILSRSVEAQKASQQIVDATLEAKARKHLREQKILALEKGRVKNVLADDNIDGTSTGETMQLERRLRKTAHRGVIMLFRAVREAQERAVEAEKEVRKEGVIGSHQRQEKVNEMSRQGFLDLIAHGGGKPKRGGIEEA
ncbi:Rrp15p-domain-containing protein [Poronia punctata]|nr:Rrp15p-domain-containing protein [Poronia punctata]